jgi:hypothetical protein
VRRNFSNASICTRTTSCIAPSSCSCSLMVRLLGVRGYYVCVTCCCVTCTLTSCIVLKHHPDVLSWFRQFIGFDDTSVVAYDVDSERRAEHERALAAARSAWASVDFDQVCVRARGCACVVCARVSHISACAGLSSLRSIVSYAAAYVSSTGVLWSHTGSGQCDRERVLLTGCVHSSVCRCSMTRGSLCRRAVRSTAFARHARIRCGVSAITH